MGPFSSANIRRSPRRDEPDGEMHKGTDEGERTIKNEREIKCWGWCLCVYIYIYVYGLSRRDEAEFFWWARDEADCFSVGDLSLRTGTGGHR